MCELVMQEICAWLHIIIMVKRKLIFFVHWSLNLDGHNQPTDIRERKERDGTKSPVTGNILLK